MDNELIQRNDHNEPVTRETGSKDQMSNVKGVRISIDVKLK